MSNVRILAKNIADPRYISSISASPAMLATLPESNLILPTERGQVARTTSTASQGVTVAWAADQKANMVALTRTNLTTSATLRSVLSNSVPATLVDTTALTAFSTTGLDTDLDDYTDDDFRGLKTTVQYFTLQTTLRSLALTLADASNPDAYMEVNRLHVGKYFEFTYNPTGEELTLMDASVQGRADDGTHSVDKLWRARKIVLNLDLIRDDTSDLATTLALLRRIGKSEEVFLDFYPGSATAIGLYHRGAFRLTDSPSFNPHQYGVHKNTMTFEET